MSLSLIFIASDKKTENEKTLQCIKQEVEATNRELQLLMYGCKEDLSLLEISEKLIRVQKIEIVDRTDILAILQSAADKVTGKYITGLESGDTWSQGTLEFVFEQMEKNPKMSVFMLNKIMQDEKSGAFANDSTNRNAIKVNLDITYHCYPFYLGGTFFEADFLQKYKFDMNVPVEVERKFFLDLCLEKKKIMFLNAMKYYSYAGREGDIAFYEGTYDIDYYTRSFTEFWLPYLEEMDQKYGKIPKFIQYHVMFTIRSRIIANLNNRNKHVIETGKEEECLELMGTLLKKIDEDIVFNVKKLAECDINNTVKWIYGILRNGEDYTFRMCYHDGIPYYAGGNNVFSSISNLKTNILFMDYRDSKLEIDGSVNALLYSMAEEVYLTYNGKKIPIVYNERYSHTKVFGISIYKAHSFHATISLEELGEGTLYCIAKIDGELIKIRFMYDSHFSRMSGRFKNSYWFFGREKQYLMLKDEDGLRVKASNNKEHKKTRNFFRL